MIVNPPETPGRIFGFQAFRQKREEVVQEVLRARTRHWDNVITATEAAAASKTALGLGFQWDFLWEFKGIFFMVFFLMGF